MRAEALQLSMFETIHRTRLRTAELGAQLRVSGDRARVASSNPKAAAELLAASLKQTRQIVDTYA